MRRRKPRLLDAHEGLGERKPVARGEELTWAGEDAWPSLLGRRESWF
jgi:hypothetical protein